MTKKELLQILAMARAAFPHSKIDANATANIWYLTFGNETPDVCLAALQRCIQTSDHFPTVHRMSECIRFVKMVGVTSQVPALESDSAEIEEGERVCRAVVDDFEKELRDDCASCPYDKYNYVDPVKGMVVECRRYMHCVHNI